MIFNIYYSIVILSRVYNITNQLNDQLPVGLLAQLVVRCTGGANVSRISLDQFSSGFGFFPECKSYVFNSDDHFLFRLCSTIPSGSFWCRHEKLCGRAWTVMAHGTSRSHTSNIAPERFAERVWWAKSQSSPLNVYFRLSGFQTSVLAPTYSLLLRSVICISSSRLSIFLWIFNYLSATRLK